MNKENRGKYPLQFWITQELKDRSDKVRKETRKSHKDLYEDGVKTNEEDNNAKK